MSSATVRDWSKLKHGTWSDFVLTKVEPAWQSNNLEQIQAAAIESASLVNQFASDPDNGLSKDSRLVPQLGDILRSRVTLDKALRMFAKYCRAFRNWQEELTWEERETFVSTVFVWE